MKKLPKKAKKDFEATRDFYLWLSEQNDLSLWKRDWPEFERIEYLSINQCAFCAEWYRKFMWCSKNCPLRNELGHCYRSGSTFSKCACPKDYRKTEKAQLNLRKSSALKIAQFTDQFIKKTWGKTK